VIACTCTRSALRDRRAAAFGEGAPHFLLGVGIEEGIRRSKPSITARACCW